MRGGGIGPLQHRCEEILERLGLSHPFTLEELVGAISKSRGRPLQVVYQDIGPGEKMPCGVWVPLPEGDVVVVESRTSRAHQEHICLHELAHILCAHTGAKVLAAGYLAKLLPDIAPEKVATMLARTSYGSEQERDAEAMATLLGRFLAPGGADGDRVRRAHKGAGDDVLGELAKALRLGT